MYPIERASSRYRLYQYLGGLQQQGIDARVVEAPAVGWRSRPAYVVRLLREAAATDVIFVQKRTLWKVIHMLRAINRHIVYDFDDALYVRPEEAGIGAPLTSSSRVRAGLRTILRVSKHVIAGNEYLAAYARRFNSHVTVIPTVLDMQRYQACKRQSGDPVVLGWVGHPGNLVYLKLLIPVFDELDRRYGERVVLKVISSRPFETEVGLEVINQPWRLEKEVEDLWDSDIGLMPLSDSAWTRGKCGFKALQFMALEIPTVASPVGVNADIIADGSNGFLATSTQEWVDKLARLIESPHLRDTLGRAGRKTVEDRYSLDKAMPRLAAILKAVGEGKGPDGYESQH
jgi:glycosyltransferase involved in cell wall biosynthesis